MTDEMQPSDPTLEASVENGMDATEESVDASAGAEDSSEETSQAQSDLPMDLQGDGTHQSGSLPAERLKSILESLFLSTDRPITLTQLTEVLPEFTEGQIESALEHLMDIYGPENSGMCLLKIASGYQLRTHPENALWVLRFQKAKPTRLSRAALETLAIVAYRQPMTRPEIDEIRGVDSGTMLRQLLDRSLVRILGKKEEPGNPLIYGTTKEFLEFFSLNTLGDLPPLKEYAELGEDSLLKLQKLFPEDRLNMSDVPDSEEETTEVMEKDSVVPTEDTPSAPVEPESERPSDVTSAG